MPEPIKRIITIYQGSDFGFGLGLIATDLDGTTEKFDTTGYTAALTIRQNDYDGDAMFEATDADYIAVGYDPPPAERNTAYTLGQRVIPDDGLNGYIYECTIAGTSHVTNQPTWPTAVGQTVTDDTVTWTCVATDATAMNLRVAVPSSVTAALDDWGTGVWCLDVTDTWGNTVRVYHGAAYLSRRTTY